MNNSCFWIHASIDCFIKDISYSLVAKEPNIDLDHESIDEFAILLMKHLASLVVDDKDWKDGFGDAINVTKYQVCGESTMCLETLTWN